MERLRIEYGTGYMELNVEMFFTSDDNCKYVLLFSILECKTLMTKSYCRIPFAKIPIFCVYMLES